MQPRSTSCADSQLVRPNPGPQAAPTAQRGAGAAWDLWWTNLVTAHEKTFVASETALERSRRETTEPSVGGPPVIDQVWGILYVPRAGGADAKPIVEGFAVNVLGSVGIGRNSGTRRAGREGIVGLRGHGLPSPPNGRQRTASPVPISLFRHAERAVGEEGRNRVP